MVRRWRQDCRFLAAPWGSVDPGPVTPSDWHPITRGFFPRLIFGLGRSAATGVLTVSRAAGRPEVLVLRRGALMVAQADALGRQATRTLETIASWTRGRYHWEGGLAAYPPGSGSRSFDLGAWVRKHYESQLDQRAAAQLAAELAGVRLCLKPGAVIPDSLCDATDRRILAALVEPRRLEQLWSAARCPRFRLLCVVHFLRRLDLLQQSGVAARVEPSPPMTRAHQLLGVESNADPVTLKRAYRRRVRALHPDLRAPATDRERRRLEERLAELNRAYAEATRSPPRGAR